MPIFRFYQSNLIRTFWSTVFGKNLKSHFSTEHWVQFTFLRQLWNRDKCEDFLCQDFEKHPQNFLLLVTVILTFFEESLHFQEYSRSLCQPNYLQYVLRFYARLSHTESDDLDFLTSQHKLRSP